MNSKRRFPGTSNTQADSAGGASADGDARMMHDDAALRQAWSSLEAPDPPQLVDRAVLNAARRAVARSARRGRRLRWLGGLATASVVVLTVAIVMQQDGHAPPSKLQLRGDGAPAKRAASVSQAEPELRARPAAQEESKTTAEVELMAAAKAAPAAAANAAAEQDTSSLADEAPPPADEWMKRLRTLWETGPPDAFRAELDAFRAAYPDYPLPKEWLK